MDDEKVALKASLKVALSDIYAVEKWVEMTDF